MSNEAITWAMRQHCKSPAAKLVLFILADKADEQHSCYPGQEYLAAITGQSVRTVRRQLIVLEEDGLISRTRRYGGDGNRTSDRYVLPVRGRGISLPDNMTGSEHHRTNQVSLPAKSGDLTGHGCPGNPHNPKKNPKASALFDEFWSIYPRREAKGEARKAWERAVKKSSVVDILAGAERYRDDPNRESAFTAHPATWLNQERWDDDPLPSRGGDQASGDSYGGAAYGVFQ